MATNDNLIPQEGSEREGLGCINRIDITDKLVGIYYSKNGEGKSLFIPHHILIDTCESVILPAVFQTVLERKSGVHIHDKTSQ